MRGGFWFAVIALVGLGCAGAPEFRDAPVVWAVDDRKTIPEPEEAEFLIRSYIGDVLLFDRLMRGLSGDTRERAKNINAVGEVPNSSWFTNRIGLFDMTPERIARGPLVEGPPRPPLKVVRAKVGGGNPGFVVDDASGRTFLIKFDPRENPEMQTGTNVLVNRILWAAGYNVPKDYVFWFRRDDIAVAEEVTSKDAIGRKSAFDDRVLDDMLALVPREPDGGFRATASEYLEGIPKGGFRAFGVREDDPNDVIPHEDRRELRGLRVIAAWLNHTDFKDDNTLDMYVEEGGRKYLKHYFVDFGEALGAHRAEKGRLDDGYEYTVDWARSTKALLSLGLWVRPWENSEPTEWPAIGVFSADHFDPVYWREAYPYQPFAETTPEDFYWGAKIVVRFTDAHIRAVVEAAEFSSPEATAYLAETLERRRDAIGRTWLDGVTPLDDFFVRGRALCMKDLAVSYGYADPAHIEQLAGGRVIARHRVAEDGEVCVPIPKQRYSVIRLRTVRDERARPAMQLHLRGGPEPRVLGVVRVED